MDKQKNHLVDALVRLGCAQADTLLEADSPTPPSSASTEQPGGTEQAPVRGGDQQQRPDSTSSHVSLGELDETWTQVQKWVDVNDSKVSDTYSHCSHTWEIHACNVLTLMRKGHIQNKFSHFNLWKRNFIILVWFRKIECIICYCALFRPHILRNAVKYIYEISFFVQWLPVSWEVCWIHNWVNNSVV